MFVTSVDHDVLALDVATGATRWQVKLPSTRPAYYGMGSVYANGIVVVGDQDVFALGAETGAAKWRFTPTRGRNPGLFLPTIDNGTVYCGSSSGHIYALDLVTGELEWEAKIAGKDTISVYHPSVVDGVAYVAYTAFNYDDLETNRGGVAAFDAQTGRQLWEKNLPQLRGARSPTATIEPAVAMGTVIAGSRDGPVYALSTADGTMRWALPPAIRYGGTTSLELDLRPLATNGTVFIVGTSGAQLLGVDPVSGVVRWSYQQAFGSTGWVGASGDDVFLVYGGGQMDVVDAESGRLKWRVEDRNTSFQPAVTDSVLVVAGDGVRALRRF